MQLAAPTWKYLWEVKATETNPDFFKSLKPEMADKKRNGKKSQSNHYWEKLFSQENSCCITKYTTV